MSKKLSLQELPQEIITHILSRLPVKSLLQCKSVSKLWLSLISSPHFAKLHLHQMKLNNTIARRIFSAGLWSFSPDECVDDNGNYNHQEVTPTEHPLPIMEVLIRLPHNLVDSCNGLICIVCENEVFLQYRHFAVVNPTTRQFREVEVLDYSYQGLIFCGFGYDSKIDDYKIVRGVVLSPFDNPPNKARIEIFSLKNNSWRIIQVQDQHCSAFLAWHGVFLNGILHWLSCGEIVRFDLEEERFLDPLPLPSHHETLVVLDECLFVYTPWRAENSPMYIEAWKMMNYGVQSSWTKIYHFNDGGGLSDYAESIELLYISKRGCHWFVQDGGNLMVHNPKDKRIDPVQLSVNDCYWGVNTVYVESLVSPNIAE